jgi:hypothetical protein
MTLLTTIVTVWLISGVISAIWHIVDEWHQHEIFESTPADILVQTVIMTVLCLIGGPIGLVVKAWETWFDPTNI